jgi:sugar phosphate isomerase/epimerase
MGPVLSQGLAREQKTWQDRFGFCLNTSTISGQKLGILDIVKIAAKAGYQGIEPWMRELDQHVKHGGNLKQVGQAMRDEGLRVPSAIAFLEWIVDDPERRKQGLEEARRSLAAVQQIGGLRLACPPAGGTGHSIDLGHAAERYRALLELGDQFGVVPEVELWGFSQTLGKLGDVASVAIQCGHAKACILTDVYHLYKGGSPFSGVRLLSGLALPVVHFNDYPSEPPRGSITDAQRVYPGAGVAPLKEFVRDLNHIGFDGMLSLELFNRDYWNQDALTVARTGLEKMRALVHAALG